MIKDNRQEITDVIKGSDDRLLAIVGPCSDQLDRTIMEEGMSLLELSDNKIKYVHRSPPWKPRSNPNRDWQGLDQTDPEHALYRKYKLSSAGVPVSMEYGHPRHERFVPTLSFMWIGSRAVENTLLLDFAIKHTKISLGIKNGMDGDIQTALDQVNYVNAQRSKIYENPAPAILIHRGGNNITNPDSWEDSYLKAHYATGGKFIVDGAHGGEMAHDTEGRFAKSILGQLACLAHIRDLSAAGYAPKGLMVEASDVVIIDKYRQTDPNLAFDDALKMVNLIAEARIDNKSKKSMIC